MPLANGAAVEGYLLRIESMLQDYIQIGLEEYRLTPIRIGLDEADPLASLKNILEARA